MAIPLTPHKLAVPDFAFIAVLLFISTLSAQGQWKEHRSAQWRVAGQNLGNTRSQPEEHSIRSSNVSNLSPKWSFTTGGDVSATPTVDGDAVYFPDFGGNLFAVNKDSGALVWSHKISDYVGVDGAFSRVSPAVWGEQVFIGDILGTNPVRTGADVISVDRDTGSLRWITTVDSHPAAIITGSPVVFDGIVYIGVSSGEEGLADNPAYPCCTFRGSVVALDAKTGRIVWKTYDVPDNGGQPGGYSGGAVWVAPAIDARRGALYIGTGNNYTAPADVEACQNADPTAECAAPDDHFDSVLALDLKTGKIKWAKRLQGVDTWTLACITPTAPKANCPVPSSHDFDFGSGPNLLGDLVGIGQKSGIYWALDADDGDIVWSTPVGPSGELGGILWGTATDGRRIYVPIANDKNRTYSLVPSGQTITWGAWSALDARTGKILWQTADPTAGAIDAGSVSVANGVVYAGSSSGQMYAMDTMTGNILWSFASGGSVIDGPSIVDGSVYWGSGYGKSGIGNNKVYKFTLPDFDVHREHRDDDRQATSDHWEER